MEMRWVGCDGRFCTIWCRCGNQWDSFPKISWLVKMKKEIDRQRIRLVKWCLKMYWLTWLLKSNQFKIKKALRRMKMENGKWDDRKKRARRSPRGRMDRTNGGNYSGQRRDLKLITRLFEADLDGASVHMQIFSAHYLFTISTPSQRMHACMHLQKYTGIYIHKQIHTLRQTPIK